MKPSFGNLHSSASALSACLFASYLSAYFAKAQLLGCNEVNCPQNPDLQPYFSCPVDGAVNTLIGIANLTTALVPQPLTWTVGISQSPNPANSTESVYSRNFYLGAPPRLDLVDLSNTTGCALFFEGISSQLKFAGPLEYSVGTCSDALSAGCVTDLLNQATSILATLDPTLGNVCEALESALVNNAPSSCGVAQRGSWGNISAKAITGPSAPFPVTLGDCTPTTGKDYSVTHVETQNLTAPDLFEITEPFLGGVTPILTIFKPGPNNSSNDGVAVSAKRFFQSPDVHLSCVKVFRELQATGPSVIANLAPVSAEMSTKLVGSLLFVFAMTVVLF